MTPSSSSSFRMRRMPVVTTTAALSGFLPVAKALGISVLQMPTSGMGRPALSATFLTMLYRRGSSASVTMRTRYARRELYFENQ